ncbi:hypothetical protein [Dyadobacter frigoris]|uniref:Integral membrane protein n=1 Tax=Dyadobacter frigoris TaxID=2576211 RepID=A0A4U6CYD2_9BACT|nr:hypothetical protein [Dyadobacter frigoris]TKT89346.1 hypothetical protein FDK13_23635 [Dyadobacter frigoris]GLU55518.1 hypothetical protein Dfri01_49790 [Dyadobacter frigoris]
MTFIKIITVINWILIGVYGGFVVWAFIQESKPSHEMPGVESIIKGAMFLMLLVLIGLNITVHQWMKILAMLIAIVLLLIVRQVATN